MRRFLCWIGWHSWKYEIIGYDGYNCIAKCKWCGHKGMVDSQGNLFGSVD